MLHLQQQSMQLGTALALLNAPPQVVPLLNVVALLLFLLFAPCSPARAAATPQRFT